MYGEEEVYTQHIKSLWLQFTHVILLHLPILKLSLFYCPMADADLLRLYLLHQCASHVCGFGYCNEFMNLCLCDLVCIWERGRKKGSWERDLQQLRLDPLTLLKMTYQITQRTGICPCPWFTSNCFIVLHSQSMWLLILFENVTNCVIIGLKWQDLFYIRVKPL